MIEGLVPGFGLKKKSASICGRSFSNLNSSNAQASFTATALRMRKVPVISSDTRAVRSQQMQLSIKL